MSEQSESKAPVVARDVSDLDPTLDGPSIARDRFVGVAEGASLRGHAARGALVNSTFNIGLLWVGLARRFAIAAFLTTVEYGLWGLVLIAMMSILLIKEIGIGDKYIQQNEVDQEAAFQKAFTLEAIVSGFFFVVALVAFPVFALIYGEPSMILPGCVFSLVLPLSLLSFPRIVFYRRMQFGRQRLLEAIDPIVGIVATIALGALGAGYWSLVIGVLAGSVAAGVVTAAMSPYPMRFRYDRGTVRKYASFSWPLVVAHSSVIVGLQGTILAGKASVGLAGIGVLGLASNFSSLAGQVDAIVTRTLYPLVCAVADRIDLLHESFVKTNRMALMWAVPFGLGLALFAQDLVHHVLGDRWSDAIPVLRGAGVAVAISQIGFNWAAFMRARGDTRGIAVVAVGSMLGALGLAVPALLFFGLTGFVWASIAQALLIVALRGYYLRRMFRGFSLVRHMARAIAPSIPAVAVVYAIRLVQDADRTLAVAAGELTLYVLVTAAFTWLLERQLLRELMEYLRGALPARHGAIAT